MSVTLGPRPSNEDYPDGSPIDVPRAASGTIAPLTDLDHFRFILATSATIRADLDAADALMSLLDGTLKLNDSSGTLATDSGNPDPYLSREQGPGDYSVSVQGPCVGTKCVPEDSYYVLFVDTDPDGDSVVLPVDTCPTVANAAQMDSDRDGVGDPCDNCPSVFNPDQLDTNADGQGDACPGPCAVPPESALDLVFMDRQTMVWTATSAATSYDLYRGGIDGPPWNADHVCLRSALPGPSATDPESPTTGRGFYYLVAGSNGCGEGTLGSDSSGTPRSNPDPCP